MNRPAALRHAALLLLLLTLAACTQPLPVDKRDYIGHWQGEGVRLVIQTDGQASYERVKDKRRMSINGPTHSFTTDGFKIGIGPLSARFKVSSAPAQTDGKWRMTVDGVVLTRRDLGEQLQKNQPSIDL
ncbi:MAG: hypothetical protein K0M70_07070 [Arenimonas sp.]|uniref:hypothetical protein n=1 Tax=Arenimonas sp. TaxID=1872635 RepID=UPI0025C29080|nr:hypothetical protein [Arenimonas sp.]MBW8367602.1 hypothetical protein [Arenimonas sp.]